MKKILLASLLSISLVSSLSAYELNGNLGVKWTGFKTMKKVPVSGTFNTINLDIKSSASLSDFLTSANKVEIIFSFLTESFDSNEADLMITFALPSAEIIEGSILEVNEDEKSLILNVTMNEVTNPVKMDYTIENGKIVAIGNIDVLDFLMENSFMDFAEKCSTYHENKSFSDVDIEFTIPYK